MTEILYQGNEAQFRIKRLSDETNFYGTGKGRLAN